MAGPDAPAPTLPKTPEAAAWLVQMNMGRILRPLVLLASAIAFYFNLRQFLFPAFILRYSPDEAYVAILAAYAGHRELRRWSQDPGVIQQSARRGEYFVVFWWAFYFMALASANEVARYRLPEGLLSLCVQITAVFFGTLASQHLYKGKQFRALSPEPRGNGSGGPDRLDERILSSLAAAGRPLSSAELEEQLEVSRSTILRAMARLEKSRQVRWIGKSDTDPSGGFELRQS